MSKAYYKDEFPNFDGELPEIEGFADQSWHNDACPCLINEELHLKLFVDYIDPEKSEHTEFRKSGDMKRYSLHQLTEENESMPEGNGLILHSDDLTEILAAIDRVKVATPKI